MVNCLKQTNSIVGKHQEPQQNPPMSQITIVESKPYDLMAQLPNRLIMDIIKLVDGGLNTHKKKFSNVMTEFKSIDGLEWIEKGCGMEEAFQLDSWLPLGVFRAGAGLEIDVLDLTGRDNVKQFKHAERWIDRLGLN